MIGGVFYSGHGDSNGKNIPTLVKDLSSQVGQVACGSSHTIAVSQDGRTVWTFGGGAFWLSILPALVHHALV